MSWRSALAASSFLLLAPESPGAAEGVFFLVRHAEKVDDSEDPDLTKRGIERASALARLLEDAGVEVIYSTDFVRTLETAWPLAETLGLEIRIYDPDRLRPFAERLVDAGRRTLVVGHSNTTPELVKLLGGEPGPPIADDEYDRLYLVVRTGEGRAVTTLLRYPP